MCNLSRKGVKSCIYFLKMSARAKANEVWDRNKPFRQVQPISTERVKQLLVTVNYTV